MRDQSRSLSQTLGPADRQRLDLMLTSIREAEQRLQQDQAWVMKPKPKVQAQPFTDDYHTDLRTLDRERQWFDLVHLALQTDSTRVIALWIWSHGRIDLPDVAIAHHDATHHGQDEAKIKQLALIEESEMALFAGLLGKMKATNENGSIAARSDGGVLREQPGQRLGGTPARTCRSCSRAGASIMPGHVAFDRKNNEPLSNLFVCMLHQVDIEPIGSAAASARSAQVCKGTPCGKVLLRVSSRILYAVHDFPGRCVTRC